MWNYFIRASLILLAWAVPVHAATLDVVITDASGKPVPNAVVTISPVSGAMASRVPQNARIDQHHEAFVPSVVVVRRGGEVAFSNSDPTMHQVYSFSGVKQFQLEVDKGQTSKPVVFEKAGVAAVGCNIHDRMIAHVIVTEAPFAVVTDAKGAAQIPDMPDGAYQVAVWHKQLPQNRPLTSIALTVSGSSKFTNSIPVRLTSPNAPSRMHMDY